MPRTVVCCFFEAIPLAFIELLEFLIGRLALKSLAQLVWGLFV